MTQEYFDTTIMMFTKIHHLASYIVINFVLNLLIEITPNITENQV